MSAGVLWSDSGRLFKWWEKYFPWIFAACQRWKILATIISDVCEPWIQICQVQYQWWDVIFVFGQQIFSLFHNIPIGRWSWFAWQRLTRVLQIRKVQREAFCQHFKTSLSPFEIYLAQVLDFFLENWTLKRWRKNSLLGTAHYSVISFKTPIILNNITLMLKKRI